MPKELSAEEKKLKKEEVLMLEELIDLSSKVPRRMLNVHFVWSHAAPGEARKKIYKDVKKLLLDLQEK